MKMPNFLKKELFNDIEDTVNEYNLFLRDLWAKNAQKTEIPIYTEEPKIRSKKLIELPVINSKKENDLTYVFLGPYPQIPKYNIKLTDEIVSLLQSTKSTYNDLLAYVSETYSVLLRISDILCYEETRHSTKSHYRSGLGRPIAQFTSNLKKEELAQYSFRSKEEMNSDINNMKMRAEINLFGEIARNDGASGVNHTSSLNKNQISKLKQILPTSSKSLLVICEDKDFANDFCKE